MTNRDLVCIGGSAGALGATEAVLSALDEAPVAVCIVHHIDGRPSILDRVLQRSTKLDVRFAEHGEALEHGRAYVAPPDRHLIVHDGKVQLLAGARENRTRPAIDPLFRSAAVARGARTIGIVLSGHLDDGAAGVVAIDACGGAALVQSPDEAVASSMPQAAIAALDGRVSAVASARELGFLAADMAHRPVPDQPQIPGALVREHDIFLRAGDMDELAEIADASGLSCPDCGGPLSRLREMGPEHYRCNVGHAYSLGALAESQRGEIERALWVALRAIEQRSRVLESLLADARGKDRSSWVARLEDDLAEMAKNRELLRGVLFGEVKST